MNGTNTSWSGHGRDASRQKDFKDESSCVRDHIFLLCPCIECSHSFWRFNKNPVLFFFVTTVVLRLWYPSKPRWTRIDELTPVSECIFGRRSFPRQHTHINPILCTTTVQMRKTHTSKICCSDIVHDEYFQFKFDNFVFDVCLLLTEISNPWLANSRNKHPRLFNPVF